MSIRRVVAIGLLFFIVPYVYGSKCPKQEAITRHVVCYYEGRTSLSELNICNCTDVVFADVARIADNFTLDIFEDARKDSDTVRQRKDDLSAIFTLTTKPEQSSAILKSENKRHQLKDSIASFLHDSQFNGVELNFQFAAQDGTSKESLVAFLKELRNALDAVAHPRTKRGGYDVFEKLHDDVTTASYSTQRSKTIRNGHKPQTTKKVVVKRRKNSRTTREEKRENVDFYDEGEEELASVDEDLEEESVKRRQRRRKELDEGKTEDDGSEEYAGAPREDFKIFLRLSIQPELIAKKYDLKAMSKYVDVFMVPTHNIVDDSEKHVTYHHSRLMGLSDMLNTDSILDLLTGMGAPKSRLVITIPATVLKYQLADASKNTPRSPTTSGPQVIDQSQLCSLLSNGDWTVERDDDLTAPYAFSNKTWLAFEDKVSVNIKGKYILLRNLAGGAIYPIDADVNGETCSNQTGVGGILTNSLFNNFRSLERKPRALVLESLQEEIHDTSFASVEAGVKLSEYRIVRVVDHSGAVHVIRRNTKTEFECSRQGYFSHPLGCNKFYRCVKFNQYSDDFTVFEYDCPAGLAFDERWEVCVWPGSLPHGAPCTGSSEIAPVPRSHYECPNAEGYYADPENCRWFFACLDHARDGLTPLTAYEFRCPFGLVFDEGKLACDWPWLVGGCGNRGLAGVVVEKYAGATSGVQTATFINGGNLEASYGQYGTTGHSSATGLGGGFGNLVTGFGSSYAAGSGYIAGGLDDNQNRAAYATLPDYEISGGRILNQGGVVLSQNLNLLGISAPSGNGFNEIGQYSSLESLKSHNAYTVDTHGSQPSGYAYEKPAVKFELPLQQSTPLLQTLQPPVVQTVTEKAILTKLEPSYYQYPLSTPRPFSVELPSVQVNEEKASGYSSQTIVSSTPQTLVTQKPVTEGYVYEKPAIQLQLPVVTPKPQVQLFNVQQSTVSEGYVYDKPKVKFELPVVTPQPEVHIQQVTPVVQHVQPVVTQHEVVNSISIQPTVQLSTPKPFTVQQHVEYEQPEIRFQPIAVKPKQYVQIATATPIVHQSPPVVYQQTPKPIVQAPNIYVTPVQVSSPRPVTYHQEIVQPVQVSTVKSISYEHKEYLPPVQVTTAQPVSTLKQIFYEPKQLVTPIQVSTPRPLVYQQPIQISTPRPVVYQQQQVVQPVQKQVVYQQQHVVQPVQKQVVYEQQHIVQPVQKQVVYQQQHVVQPVQKQVVYQQQHVVQPVQKQVVYEQQHIVQPVQKQVVYEHVVQPVQISSPKPVVYQQEIVQPIQISTPKPVVYQQQQQQHVVQPVQISSPRPVVYEQHHVAQPVQVSTPKPVVYQQQVVQPVHISSPKPVVYQQKIVQPVHISTPKPVVYQQQVVQPVQVSTPKPVVYQQEVVQPIHISTPRPQVYQQEYIQYKSQPVVYEQKQVVQPVQISTPKPQVYQQQYVEYKSIQPVQVSQPKPIVYQPQYVDIKPPQTPRPLVYQPAITSQRFEFSQPKQYLPPVTPVVQEQKQIVQPVTLVTPKPVVYQQEFVQVKQKPVVYEQKQIAQPITYQQYLPPKPVKVSTVSPVVYRQEYVQQKPVVYEQQPVVVKTPKTVVYEEKQIVSTPKPVVYQQPQIVQQVHISTPKPIVKEQVYYEQQYEINTPKSVIVEQRFRQRKPIEYQQAYEEKQYLPPVQVTQTREYLPPVKVSTTTETVLLQEPVRVKTPKPVVYVQQTTPKPVIFETQSYVTPVVPTVRSRTRFRVKPQEEYVVPQVQVNEYLPPVRVKEQKAIYIENYERGNPALSVLQQEIIQPVTERIRTTSQAPVVISSNEYLPPQPESVTVDQNLNLEIQKINQIDNTRYSTGGELVQEVYTTSKPTVKTAFLQTYQQYENVTSGYDYSPPTIRISPAIKYELNSNIEIAPPPEEYLIDAGRRVSTSTQVPEFTTRYTARPRTRVRVRPTTSTDATLEYNSRGYLPPTENYPTVSNAYLPPQRRRPTSRKSKTKTTVVTIGQVDKEEVDDSNVEVLLDKYSGKFGDLLDEDKEKFVTKVIKGDGRGKIKVGKEPEVSTVGYEITSSRSRQRGRGRKYGTSTSTTTTARYEEYEISPENEDGTTTEATEDENGDKNDEDTADVSLASLDLKNLKLKKDKKTVIVVSQVSDANPLLIGKLASQCSCQSNNVELKKTGRRPDNSRRRPVEDSEDEYDLPSRSREYLPPENNGRRRGKSRRPNQDSQDNIAIEDTTPRGRGRGRPSEDDTSEATIVIGGPRGRSQRPKFRVSYDAPSINEYFTSTTLANDISSSYLEPSSESTPKIPISTEAIFIPEKPTGRRIPSRSRTRTYPQGDRYADPSQNGLSADSLFSPIPADEIASTVDYATIKSTRPGSRNEIDPEQRGRGAAGNGREPSKVAAGAAFDRYGPGGWRGADETLQGSVDCKRPGLFRHPKYCNKFYACNYDPWKKRYTLHVFNCPIHLAYDSNLGACNWPSKGPACSDDNLLV